MLWVDDIFSASVVAWRREEILDLVGHGVLTRAAAGDEGGSDGDG